MPNAYASKICAGKIKDPSGVKRKDFKGRKPAAAGGQIKESNKNDKKINSVELIKKRKESKKEALEKIKKELGMKAGGLMEATAKLKRQGLKEGGGVDTGKKGERRSRLLTAFMRSSPRTRGSKRAEKMGGGIIRPMYRKGGGVCLRGMNRDAIGKNS